jgi:hypothetical protein
MEHYSFSTTRVQRSCEYNCSIRITTALADRSIEGQIFSVDPSSSLVAIKETDGKPAPPNPNTLAAPSFRIISVANIASFQLLGEPESVETFAPVTQAEREMMRKREADAIKKEKKKQADKGKGVTKEAQELYDFIGRTYVKPTPHPVCAEDSCLPINMSKKNKRKGTDSTTYSLPIRWNDKQIVVSDSVVIDPPYTVNDTKAPSDKRIALPQIKKVVEAFWQKKKKPTAPALPQGRKGG